MNREDYLVSQIYLFYRYFKVLVLTKVTKKSPHFQQS